MKYKIGEIVKLMDDGDTEFEIMATKDDDARLMLKAGFDYFIRRMGDKNKIGPYIRHVFEKNIYEDQSTLAVSPDTVL